MRLRREGWTGILSVLEVLLRGGGVISERLEGWMKGREGETEAVVSRVYAGPTGPPAEAVKGLETAKPGGYPGTADPSAEAVERSEVATSRGYVGPFDPSAEAVEEWKVTVSRAVFRRLSRWRSSEAADLAPERGEIFPVVKPFRCQLDRRPSP